MKNEIDNNRQSNFILLQYKSGKNKYDRSSHAVRKENGVLWININKDWEKVSLKRFFAFRKRGQKVDATYINYMIIAKRLLNEK